MIAAGLRGALVDPLDTLIMTSIRTAEMLTAEDPFCARYLAGVRAGQIASPSA
jgi:hypothetical protein